MQYDIDCRSKHAKNFKTIRKILLSYKKITEVKNAKQTSYRDNSITDAIYELEVPTEFSGK